METRYIDVDKKWGIVIIYDFNVEEEQDELEAIMQSFGMSIRNSEKSLRILSTFNSGMAVSDTILKMSAVFIGDATSNAQWWSTIAHELHHVATTITDYYGKPYYKEGSAYLHGYLFQRIVEEIAVPCAE